VNIAFKV